MLSTGLWSEMMKAACQEKQATNVILMRTLMGGALLWGEVCGALSSGSGAGSL